MDNKLNVPNFQGSGETKLNKNLPRINNKMIEAGIRKKELENENEAAARGLCGKFFGSGDNSAKNIAGLLIVFLVFAGILYTITMLYINYSETHSQVLDFWDILVPLITLALGYLFGSKGVKSL